jgi:hypothetical protein
MRRAGDRQRWLPLVAAVVVATGLAGCGEEPSTAEERGRRAVQMCSGHGGVVAFEDDLAICRDQTYHEVRE